MKLAFPNKVNWRIYLGSQFSLEKHFGKSYAKIVKSVDALARDGYKVEFKDLTEELLDQFIPLYEQNLIAKKNPKIFDIKKLIEQTQSDNATIQMLVLSKDDKFLGGYIFSNYENSYRIMFVVLPKSLETKIFVNNVAFLMIFKMIEKSLEDKKEYFSHGRDRNLFGLNADIGLAIFKLRCGFKPYIKDKPDIEFLDEFKWNGTDDVLLFAGDQVEKKITKSYLFTNKKDEELKSAYGAILKVAGEIGLEIISH
jgi:hypothetical protein